MTFNNVPPEPGGFLHSTLPSPSPSVASTSSAAPSSLPRPRPHPLTPGSSKESYFIEHVERRLLEISGRYEKRFNVGMQESQIPGAERKGYERFGEVAEDLENVVDIVWVSGTRTYSPDFAMVTEAYD